MALHYSHVDVFSTHPFGGNSLPVFLDSRGLSAKQMLCITKELRHFEAVFLESTEDPNVVRARVFDLVEELPFADHPIIGAAAVLHHVMSHAENAHWRFVLTNKTVSISTTRTENGYFGLLDQGTPEFIRVVNPAEWVLSAFGLVSNDLRSDLPLEVVSTGLRYLVVPVVSGVLSKAHIRKDVTVVTVGLP